MGSFVISPVRNISPEELERIKEYIKTLEWAGAKVYWPIRDTDQDDKIGLRICVDNAKALLQNRNNLIWWNKNSQGSLFDFGMAFMLQVLSEMLKYKKLNLKSLKKLLKNRMITLINPGGVEETPHKSFNNVLRNIDQLDDYIDIP